MKMEEKNNSSSDEDILAPLPPLIVRPSSNGRLPFEQGNTISHDSAIARHNILLSEDASESIHPVQMEFAKKVLQATNVRRIKEGSSSAVAFKNALTTYLLAQRHNHCYDVRSKKYIKSCKCLIEVMEVDGNLQKLVETVYNFYNLPHQSRHDVLRTRVYNIIDCKMLKQTVSQIRNKKTNQISLKGKVFVLTNFINTITHKPFVLCRHSFQKVYGIGHYTIDKIKLQYAEGGRHNELVHGLCNKQGNIKKSKQEALDSMKSFFESLKSEGENYASRQVRARLGNTYLRDNEDDVRLPPSWSKRLVYERWVYSNGWIARTDGGDSSYSSTKLYAPRPYDDHLWPEGSPIIPVVCKATFMTYWKTYYDDIKIAPSSKDTCGTCWEYKRQMAVRDRSVRNADADDSEDNTESIYETESVGGGEVGPNDDNNDCDESIGSNTNVSDTNNKSDGTTITSHSINNTILNSAQVPYHSFKTSIYKPCCSTDLNTTVLANASKEVNQVTSVLNNITIYSDTSDTETVLAVRKDSMMKEVEEVEEVEAVQLVQVLGELTGKLHTCVQSINLVFCIIVPS